MAKTHLTRLIAQHKLRLEDSDVPSDSAKEDIDNDDNTYIL